MNALTAQLGSLVGTWSSWMISMTWQVAALALLIWALTTSLRKQSASLRYALWLLVFLRLVIPPTLAAPWSIGTIAHYLAAAPDDTLPIVSNTGPVEERPKTTDATHPAPSPAKPSRIQAVLQKTGLSPALLLMGIWAVGAVALFTAMVVRSRQYARETIRGCVPITDETAKAIRSLCQQMGIGQCPTVLVSPHIQIPAVLGFWYPTILLPQSVLEDLSESHFANLVSHELAHIRRRDIQVGWLISLLLCCYWFNPLVWLANLYLRREREMACDDAVLYATKQEGRDYSSTIVRMAETFDASVPALAGSLGMLELSENLLLRVRSVLDGTRARRFGWGSAVTILILLVTLIPMGAWIPAADAAKTSDANASKSDSPSVVSSSPANHATDIDPALDRITVKFDQDMATGFSWTGGKPHFPETTGKPRWVDSRTCELPVKLEPGKLYRVGINSDSYHGFSSTKNVPADLRVIVFTTRGADPSLIAGLDAPQVVSLIPEKGDGKVDPKLDRLSVTFDRPMDTGGFSWTYDTSESASFPETTGKPQWSQDKKTCSLPVKLEPGKDYLVGLNGPDYNNFQSSFGVPLEPLRWKFSTTK